VVGKEKLLQLAPPGSFDVFVWASAGDDDVADKAIAEAVNGFDMMFVHFGNVDITGHGNQWMSEPYVRQVVATDAAVGRLLEVLPPGTTVIVTADHGGHGYNHAEGTLVDSTIPWIVSGPRIRRGHAIAQPISTVDSAATAAHVLGLQLRGDAVGRFVQEAFAH
jgi:phosphopentomutase